MDFILQIIIAQKKNLLIYKNQKLFFMEKMKKYLKNLYIFILVFFQLIIIRKYIIILFQLIILIFKNHFAFILEHNL